MTGLPAARQTDMTFKGGPITQGSLTVHIGSSGGVACSTCPGGVSVGNPVNPMLGAKVQSSEVDLALPGPMPFVLSRDYSSYQTDTPAPVGLLGPGWWLPTEVTLLQTQDLLTLNDSKGRSIRFDPLAPGQAAYSRSENLWIVRGGLERLDLNKELPVSRLNLAWMGLHEGDRRNPSLFFVTNNLLGPWWVLGTTAPADQVTGKRLQLFGINDRFGRSLRLKRSAEGHVVAVQDGVGRQYRLELKTLAGLATEASGGWGADCGVRLMAIYLTHDPHEPDLPQHPLVRYEYSPRGELIAVYGRGGNRNRAFQYHPQLLGRMVAHAYEGRPPVLYVYNEAGKVVEQQRQGALSYRFDYAEDNTTVTDSLGRKTIYHFEGQAGLRRVVKLEHPDGSVTQSRFDPSGRLTASIDALGRETRYEVNVSTGKLNAIFLPDGQQIHWDYNAQGQIVRVGSPGGARERTEYDTMGRPSASVDAMGHTTRYYYPGNNSDLANVIEDARGGKKLLTWNAVGQLLSYTDCSGSITRYDYDRWGRLVETSGEEGARSRRQYDSQGRLIAQSNALDQTSTYTYSAAGNLTCMTSPDGNSVQFEHDEQGRLTVYHYGGYTQQFNYDEAGRLSMLINENGARTTFTYDVMDRLTQQVNFDGRTQSYRFNIAGELIERNDEGLITRSILDQAGRVLQRQIFSDSLPENIQQEHFQYGEDGLLQKAWHCTELGHNMIAVEFARDPMGRVVEEVQHVIGPNEEKIWSHSVKRTFNELGIESQTLYEGLPPIEWQTYGSGHLHGMVLDGQNIIDFERDKLHREISRQFGSTKTERSYDVLSRLLHQCTHSPLIGEEEALKRQHHYNAAGQLILIDTGQGAHHYGYDKAGRLISAIQPGLALQHYRFDPAGNRLFDSQAMTTPTDNWDETVRHHMHDKSFNLLGNNEARNIHEGNLKWMDNRIKDDGEFHYDYDAWGNLRHKYKSEGNEEHRYYYDNNHRLIRYTLEADTRVLGANYHYDPFGRRVVKQVQEADKNGNLTGSLTTTFFGWDGERQVREENAINQHSVYTVYEPNSFLPLIRVDEAKPKKHTSLSQYVITLTKESLSKELIDQLDNIEKEARQNRISSTAASLLNRLELNAQSISKIINEKSECEPTINRVNIYQNDQLGAPIALINQTGEVNWSAGYDAWANALKEEGKLQQPIRLPGQYFDIESGLIFNRYRYYDSSISRYISQDPIGISGGYNLYKYPFNPVSYIDPMGLQDFGFSPGMMDWGRSMTSAAAAGIDPNTLNKPHQGPSLGSMLNGAQGTLSIDVSGNVAAGINPQIGIGVATGKNGGSWIPNFCAYYYSCLGLAAGADVGASLTLSGSNAAPTTGTTKTIGGSASAKVLGGGSVGAAVNKDNMKEVTLSAALGVGAGASASALGCVYEQTCLFY